MGNQEFAHNYEQMCHFQYFFQNLSATEVLKGRIWSQGLTKFLLSWKSDLGDLIACNMLNTQKEVHYISSLWDWK